MAMIRGLLTRLTTPRRLQGDNDVLFLESSAEFGTIVKENDIAMICPPPTSSNMSGGVPQL
jgi:hypothetical protein